MENQDRLQGGVKEPSYHILKEALACVARKGETTKSGYLIFDPSGIHIITWRKLDQ